MEQPSDSESDTIYFDAEPVQLEEILPFEYSQAEKSQDKNKIIFQFLSQKIQNICDSITKTEEQVSFLEEFIKQNQNPALNPISYPHSTNFDSLFQNNKKLSNLSKTSNLQYQKLSSLNINNKTPTALRLKKSLGFMIGILFFFVVWPFLSYKIWKTFLRSHQRRIVEVILNFYRSTVLRK